MDEHRHRRNTVVRSLVAFLVFASPQLFAQSIRLVRTDVDSGRAGFITATQMFGVDVLVSGVRNCTGVSFELQYQGSQYVVFSDWKERDLGRKGTFAYDLSDTVTGNGSIHIGALSGVPVTDPGIDDPRAVHLDFVVRPSAPNALPVSFSFIHAQAVTSDSGGRIVQLSSAPYPVVIHGFVNVFPGDADNNGIVDSRDATTVGSFLKQGSGSSNVRGYKRDPSSTLWLAQPSLVWDSSKATYADCDGSGDVTLSDNLVVQINFGKTHSIIRRDNEIRMAPPQRYDASYARLPLSAETQRPLLGFALELQFTGRYSRPIAFEPSALYPDMYVSLFQFDESSGRVYIVAGALPQTDEIVSGILGSLVFDTETAENVSVVEALGARSDGSIFSLNSLSSVSGQFDETPPPLVFDNARNELQVQSNDAALLRVFNMQGGQCLSISTAGSLSLLDLRYLPDGSYIALLQSGKSSHVCRFIILH